MVLLHLGLDAAGQVEARFQCQGERSAVASLSLLTTLIQGWSLEAVEQPAPEFLLVPLPLAVAGTVFMGSLLGMIGLRRVRLPSGEAPPLDTGS